MVFRNAFSAVTVCCVIFAVSACASPLTWGINEDYKQLDARGASDFEILLQGNVAGQITGGGLSGVTNPFANPTRVTSMDAFGNTIVRFAGSNTIPQDANTNRHFGIFGDGAKPRVLVKAWSYATAPARIPVPKSNFAFLYDPASLMLQITLENTSPDTVTFADVGYLLSSAEIPLDNLNRQVLPPSVFIPLNSLNREYLPGQFASVVLSGVPSIDYAVTYGTALFSGDSSGNAYNTTGGEWSEVLAAAQAVPEPNSVALLMTGSFLLVLRRRPRTFIMLAIAAMSALPHLMADAFVLPLRPPAFDDFPTVQIGTVGNVIIDTGAGASLVVNPASATALGMNPNGGMPANFGGVGEAAGRTGVPVPAGTAFGGATTPITPGGQAASTPPLPGTADVLNLPAGVNGLIGSTFLQNYNYGRIGSYFYLATKAQGAGGLATATAIASFLALGAPFQPGSDGRPAGAQNNLLIPTPSFAQTQFTGGFQLPVDVTSAGGTLLDVPFVISSGLTTTLFSRDLAIALGLNLGGPVVDTIGNFGTIQVIQSTVTLGLFDNPSFPAFTVPVGILSSSNDPFGFNYLGGDVLGQLAYWEISQTASDGTRFFAARTVQAIPEPSTVALLILGLATGVLTRWRRQRRKMDKPTPVSA